MTFRNFFLTRAEKIDIDLKDLITKREYPTDLNFEFHSLLAKASKNIVYVLFERTINEILFDLRSRRAPDFNVDKAAVRMHEQIVDALVEKDRERAVCLPEKHTLAVCKIYKTISK